MPDTDRAPFDGDLELFQRLKVVKLVARSPGLSPVTSWELTSVLCGGLATGRGVSGGVGGVNLLGVLGVWVWVLCMMCADGGGLGVCS